MTQARGRRPGCVRRLVVAGALTPLTLAAGSVWALQLPPTCADYPGSIEAAPIAELRSRVAALMEVEPLQAVGLLCATIPRVEQERGAESAELAWWVGSLATPLIAYLDRHDEALPLLDFALPLYRRHLGPDASEVADVHVAHAWINFRKGLMEEAAAAWERALAVRERNPGARQIELQKVLVGLAQVRLSQRRFGPARQALDRARNILDANGETVSEAAAAIQNAYTNLALREEDYLLARTHAERQLDIERRLARSQAQLVSAHVIYAQILERLDDYAGAESVLRQAIALAEADSDAPLQRHQLSALTQLAAILNDRGKPREALPFADRAVEVATLSLGDAAPRLVYVLGVRAQVHRALGRLPAALGDYRRADDIVDQHRADIEPQTLVAHFRGLGAVYAALGDTGAAQRALSEALAVAGDEVTLTTQRAETLLALARLDGVQSPARRRARLAQARTLLVGRLPDSHPDILDVVDAQCLAELEADAAPACDEAATRLAGAVSLEPGLAARVLGNQSRRADVRGNADAAYALAIESLATALLLGTPDPQWRALFRLAEVLERRGNPELAIFFGKQAIAEIERQRGALLDDHRRFERSFLADKTSVYRTLADWLLAGGRIDEGLEVLGLLKVEELHDFVLRNSPLDGEPPGPTLTVMETGWLASYRRLQSEQDLAASQINQLSRLRETGRISAAESQRLDRLLAGRSPLVRRRIGDLQQWLATAVMQPFSRRAPRILQSQRIERMRARFGDGTAFAAYLLTDSHLRVVIATNRGVEQQSFPIAAAAVQQDIGRLLDAIAGREAIAEPARALHRLLLEPLLQAAHRAGAERLVVWPDGPLRYVPFAALHDGERFLADRYPIQIYSAAGARAEAAVAPSAGSAPDRSGGSIRGLGVTRAVANHRPLPAMARELCSIIAGPIAGFEGAQAPCAADGTGRGVVAGQGFVDTSFTRQRLESLLDGERAFNLLHLGTHFELQAGNALRSSLLLGDGSRLSLDEIGRLDFRGLDLVTLSACQTGVGGSVAEDGREVEGLSALVQRRGARRVIASLWTVEDASTASLMEGLYAALVRRDGDAALALDEASAQVRAVDRYRHPYYWAGFFVAGDAP